MKSAPPPFDPSTLSKADLEEVQRLLAEVFPPQKRAALLGANGEQLELPDQLYQMMRQILRYMSERKAVFIIPEDESCTTQASADYLGVSRPFLIKLLTEGKIPHHMVGSHRRVYFKDLADYQKRRSQERLAALDAMTDYVLEHELEENPGREG